MKRKLMWSKATKRSKIWMQVHACCRIRYFDFPRKKIVRLKYLALTLQAGLHRVGPNVFLASAEIKNESRWEVGESGAGLAKV